VGLQAAGGLGSAMFLLPGSAWQRSGFGSLENNLASLVLMAVFAFALGAVAMVARFLVESMQGSRQKEQ
jgi:hypothetical protein